MVGAFLTGREGAGPAIRLGPHSFRATALLGIPPGPGTWLGGRRRAPSRGGGGGGLGGGGWRRGRGVWVCPGPGGRRRGAQGRPPLRCRGGRGSGGGSGGGPAPGG